MSRNPSNFLLLGICLVSWPGLAAETYFVQAVKADLHQAARLDSPTVVSLPRGSQIEMMEKQGLWVRAKAGAKSGWVNRLFLSSTRPVGEADLTKDIGGNLEKASRRRSSSYAVSASSRGLMTDERTRQGRALFRSDFDAVNTLEKTTFDAKKLHGFQAEAKLGE